MNRPLLLSVLLPLITAGIAVAASSWVEVNIMELTQFDWEPGGELPDSITALDGESIEIKGYMALDTPEGTTTFRLSYYECGCGNAQPNHFVQVDVDDVVGYRPERLTLRGTLSVGEETEDGFVVSLYRLKAESIE